MVYASAGISLPSDAQTNFLMLLRWIHFLAGIAWIGLLYFFNLVNVPFMKELDAATKGKIMPGLMLRALWWFRWAAVVTVLAGLALGPLVPAPEHAWLGEQSPALHRHRRRAGLDHDAQRLGSSLAPPKAPDRLDKSQRRKRNADSRASSAYGKNFLPDRSC